MSRDATMPIGMAFWGFFTSSPRRKKLKYQLNDEQELYPNLGHAGWGFQRLRGQQGAVWPCVDLHADNSLLQPVAPTSAAPVTPSDINICGGLVNSGTETIWIKSSPFPKKGYFYLQLLLLSHWWCSPKNNSMITSNGTRNYLCSCRANPWVSIPVSISTKTTAQWTQHHRCPVPMKCRLRTAPGNHTDLWKSLLKKGTPSSFYGNFPTIKLGWMCKIKKILKIQAPIN